MIPIFSFHQPMTHDPNSRFCQHLRERYDWTEEEIANEWECAKTNPQAVWSKDDYNVQVVSLLKVTNASSSRTLSHSSSVKRKENLETDDVEGAFSRSSNFVHTPAFTIFVQGG